jgi:hypothetical protein
MNVKGGRKKGFFFGKHVIERGVEKGGLSVLSCFKKWGLYGGTYLHWSLMEVPSPGLKPPSMILYLLTPVWESNIYSSLSSGSLFRLLFRVPVLESRSII